ncbi:helicase RepA family protein [Sphingomonas psychrotolerans]|uniref:Helicase RepA family protein n=1 Tax=Sphingomonas psychrotolerans TaxID=1327635 RepID=A0ABU3N427_9SPHN|nr:AAA family ATPase [Sphingomonas psychrotolerans]MDT8759217.1 helicase RepA family protein [Sphingomonas psychrotolerans]
MFFEGGPPLAEVQRQMRDVLALIQPKTAEDVRVVAAGLKNQPELYQGVFLEWAKPFGRLKARKQWDIARADPDALTDLLEMRLEAEKRRNLHRPRTAAELHSQSPQQYRVKGVFPAEGLAVVYGASGSAKSFLCVAAAAAIAEGDKFFGHGTRRAIVLYIALEGEAGYRGRTLAWQLHNGRPYPAEVGFWTEPFSLIEPQDVATIAALCPPGVVIIIDTLNRAAPGADENNSKDMGAIIAGAKTLQRETAGLVILVAHSGKDATRGLRGHSSLFAALDAAIYVERNGASRAWRVEKAKDGEDGAVHGFHLKGVTIGTDEDGDELTSAVVISEELPPPHLAKPLPQSCRLALETFHEAANTKGIVGPNGEFVGVPLQAWRIAFYRKSPAENDDAKRKAFNRARTELVERGMIAADNDNYRLAGENAAAGNLLIAACLQRDTGRDGTFA